MNRNTITSLAMLYALWEAEKKDILDLIKPFIFYIVGKTTKIGAKINCHELCTYMETEFGYKSFPEAVVRRILLRESSKNNRKCAVIKRKDGAFYLVSSLSDHVAEFSKHRTECKERTDKVTASLAEYFNDNAIYGRKNYTQEEAEKALLSFFESRGNSVLLSVETLREILSKNNEIEFHIARFIIDHNEKKTVYISYIEELIKGYFVTTALYYHAENPDISTASFNDVTFFLDTPILLAYLGYKTSPENNSVQEMVKTLKNNGAKISCFQYNIEEIENILSAYKAARTRRHNPSTITLEYFDEHQFSMSRVDAELRTFPAKLKSSDIVAVEPNDILAEFNVGTNTAGLLNDDAIRKSVLSLNPKYNTDTLPEDIRAINTISRIRKGKKLRQIEKSKAIFVTKNTTLISATTQFLSANHIDVGFPLAMTDEDLFIIAWLKDFRYNNDLPKMRLLENVLTVISPSPELMEVYFSHIEGLESAKHLSSEEATLLRIEHFARKELMALTKGNPDNIDVDVIDTIRKKMKAESFQQGLTLGKKEAEAAAQKKLEEKRIAACKKAEDEVQQKFKKIEKCCTSLIKLFLIAFALVFIVFSVLNVAHEGVSNISFALIFVAFVTTVQAVRAIYSDQALIIRIFKQKLNKYKLNKIDKRKTYYLSFLE